MGCRMTGLLVYRCDHFPNIAGFPAKAFAQIGICDNALSHGYIVNRHFHEHISPSRLVVPISRLSSCDTD